jgi:hypothetical protein
MAKRVDEGKEEMVEGEEQASRLVDKGGREGATGVIWREKPRKNDSIQNIDCAGAISGRGDQLTV